MKCPKCGSELVTKQSGKGTLYQMCKSWPDCKISGTPETMNLLATYIADNGRLMQRLEESREGLVLMMERHAELKNGECDVGKMPIRLGDVLPKPEQFEEWMARRKAK